MANIRPSTIGAFAISISAILWGFDGVVLTPRLANTSGNHLDTGYVVFVLHAFPFLLMSFFLRKEFKQWRNFSKSDLLNITMVALLGGALGTLFIVKALFTVDFQNLTVVALLQKLQPVFGIALAGIILKERPGKSYALWAALAIAAGYFLTFGLNRPNFHTGGNTLLAAGYALLAALAFSASTVLSKKVLYKFAFTTATFYRYLVTTLLMLLYMIISNKWGQFEQTSPSSWLLFAVIGITTGSGAIFLYYYGLRHVKAIVSTICELLFPTSVILFDYLINGNQLDAVQWTSVVVMFFALYMLNHRSSATPKA
ncbi:MAG: EamA family transporter [Bacteroidetes bacterium]|nr:MAG: EamA family transporter [Bacteroidota bacterium]PIE88707.1 MAG: EamA family transporter [Bacteroidota bacterium]